MTPEEKDQLLNTILSAIHNGAGERRGLPIKAILIAVKLLGSHRTPDEIAGALNELRILGLIRFEESPTNAAIRYYFPTAEGLKHLQRLGVD